MHMALERRGRKVAGRGQRALRWTKAWLSRWLVCATAHHQPGSDISSSVRNPYSWFRRAPGYHSNALRALLGLMSPGRIKRATETLPNRFEIDAPLDAHAAPTKLEADLNGLTAASGPKKEWQRDPAIRSVRSPRGSRHFFPG